MRISDWSSDVCSSDLAYQLGQISGVWEPFFPGLPDEPGKNGTEAVITSSVSEAFPIPDAALGGYTYALEIVTGIVGSRARWRTMPWLVFLFGLMIAPLGVVSILDRKSTRRNSSH